MSLRPALAETCLVKGPPRQVEYLSTQRLTCRAQQDGRPVLAPLLAACRAHAVAWPHYAVLPDMCCLFHRPKHVSIVCFQGGCPPCRTAHALLLSRMLQVTVETRALSDGYSTKGAGGTREDVQIGFDDCCKSFRRNSMRRNGNGIHLRHAVIEQGGPDSFVRAQW